MRFHFKTDYDQDVRLFKDGVQVFWYALLAVALLALPLVLPDEHEAHDDRGPQQASRPQEDRTDTPTRLCGFRVD